MRETARMLCRKTEIQALDYFKVDKSSQRVAQLRDFLSALGEPDQPFHFFPLMRQEVRKVHIHDSRCKDSFPRRMFGQSFRDSIDLGWLADSDSDFVQQVQSSDIWSPEWPISTPKAISTKASSKLLHKAIAKLDLYNALGYDIYICPNPLAFGVRSQRTVRQIITIVLEFDRNSLEQQRALLEQLKPVTVAAVYSGGKSIHIFIRLACPIWNDRCPKSFHEICTLRQTGNLTGGIEIQAYDRAVNCWNHELQQAGFEPDQSVLSNFAGLVRVPGFKHCKHDRFSTIQHLDSSARWNHGMIQHPDDWAAFLTGWNFNEVAASFPIKTGIPIHFPRIGVSQDRVKEVPEVVIAPNTPPVTAMLHQPEPTERQSGEDLAVLSEPKMPHSIKSYDLTRPVKPDLDRITTTFIEDLTQFDELRRTGIPARGQRRNLHRVLFTAARIYGWFDDQERIAAEWRAILSIEPSHIGCSVKAAVQDILGEWRAVKRTPYKIWLPDCSMLADLDSSRRDSLLAGLTKLGCPKAIRSSTCSIIMKVLWPVVRNATAFCIKGQAFVQSRRMRSAGGNKTGEARNWMRQTNLLCICDHDYVPGGPSKRSFVNVPLIIWMAGFRNEDLDWGRQQKQAQAPEAEELRSAA